MCDYVLAGGLRLSLTCRVLKSSHACLTYLLHPLQRRTSRLCKKVTEGAPVGSDKTVSLLPGRPVNMPWYPLKSLSGVLDVFSAWPAEEGDFVNLQTKHNFTMAHFGLLLGVLKNNLQELQIQHCNDIFCRTHQVSPLLMECQSFCFKEEAARLVHPALEL